MDVQSEQIEMGETPIPTPRWIAPSLTIAEGRDPLGFQTTTQDRLMPLLLPGMLELTRRARYLSFHAFLLDEYQKRRLPADSRALSSFIKRREWDLGLAVQRCSKHCGSSPVGAQRLGGTAARSGPFARDESVESQLGGYGLYYRSPMAAFGIVAKAGTLLGDRPITIDVLRKTERSAQLAEGFRDAVHHTAYYRRWMWTDDLLPAEVVDEYSAAACLCQLPERPDERSAVHDAIFGTDRLTSDFGEHHAEVCDINRDADEQVMQRRLSVAHYLTLIDTYPGVVKSESVFREGLWTPPKAQNHNHEVIAGQWAALIAKDVWQEAICSVWSGFCSTGRTQCRNLGRGLTWDEVRHMALNMITGPPRLRSEQRTGELVDALAAGLLTVADTNGTPFSIPEASLEELRGWTKRSNTAASGLMTMLDLARRANERSGEGWQQALGIDSTWQSSVAAVLLGVCSHLQGKPRIGETLWWMVSRFVLGVHERIAYSKLPEFTFRFRWEDGLLRFYDLGDDRFPLAAIRNEPLASLTRDLGLWTTTPTGDAQAVLTHQGREFAAEVFG